MTYKPEFFGDAELHGQRQFCDRTILVALDDFRRKWGRPVLISPVDGAVARFGAPRSKSQHSVDYWGNTCAVDAFPIGMDSVEQRQRAFRIAREIGFGGIGLYPDAVLGKRTGMIHLDTRWIRPDMERHLDKPATWSAWRKKLGRGWSYRGIGEAL